MAAKTKALLPDINALDIEKRRTERQLSGKGVAVKSTHGERTRAAIRDVSTYGCSLVCDATWIRMGSFVAIVVSPERSIQGIVRWSRSGVTGLEFLRPIPAVEAEALAS